MSERTIIINQRVTARNDALAARIRERLARAGVFAVNVLGAPGVGKTSLLTRLIPLLPLPSSVIEGDIAGEIDTERLRGLGIPTLQINTGGACHLSASAIDKALAELNPQPGILWIENTGNLICPMEYQIGEHAKLLISNVTEGSDKPYKYPLAFETADCLVLNKIDLLGPADFDEEFFTAGARRWNKDAPLFKISAKTGEGMDEVAGWISERAKSVKTSS